MSIKQKTSKTYTITFTLTKAQVVKFNEWIDASLDVLQGIDDLLETISPLEEALPDVE